VFDTELKFNVARLREMLLARSPTTDVESALARIILKRPLTCRALFEEIEGLESLVISRSIKLIIIDSIAALVRKEGLHDADKETFLVRQAGTLKLIAELCGCTILVTNQVASAALLTTDSEAVNPSLGPIWNHCVSIRLTIQKSGDVNQLDISQSQSQLEAGSIILETERIIRLVKSPSLSSFSLRCQMKKVGIQAIIHHGVHIVLHT
jgi:RecA/RadA recombinase